MTTIYDYADVLRMIADRKAIQLNTDFGVWADVTVPAVLRHIMDGVYTPESFRVKPDTVMVNGVECVPNSVGLLAMGYAHNVEISLLDASGRRVARTLYYKQGDDAFITFKALINPFKPMD